MLTNLVISWIFQIQGVHFTLFWKSFIALSVYVRLGCRGLGMVARVIKLVHARGEILLGNTLVEQITINREVST